MSGERLELVRDIGELTPGVRVRVGPCGCGAKHDGMIVIPRRTQTWGDLKRETVGMLPAPQCDRARRNIKEARQWGRTVDEGLGLGIGKEEIAAGLVWRWLDLDDKAEATETEKPRKLVKT